MAKVLILRTCNADGTSRSGFQWPKAGPVECPDWKPEQACGNGLHGLLWGEGDGSLLNWGINALWQVVSVDEDKIVHLVGKVKFPGYSLARTEVVHTGSRESATSYLFANGGGCKAIVGITLKGGDHSSLIGGEHSSLTGGDRSSLIGGDRSSLMGGEYSSLIGGDHSSLIGGDYSSLIGGCRSLLMGGDGSTLISGDSSTLIGGDRSALTGGYRSALGGGEYSSLTGGYCSKLMGGEGSTLSIRWWNIDRNCYSIATACVGEAGILPNTKYRLSESHTFVAIKE